MIEAGALAVAAAIGIGFGFYPARKAASLADSGAAVGMEVVRHGLDGG